jgi:hypothetical protein
MFWLKSTFLISSLWGLASASTFLEYSRPSEVHQHVFERTADGVCSLLYKRKVPRPRTLTSLDDAVAHISPRRRTYGGPRSAEEVIVVYGYREAAINRELRKHCATASFGSEGVQHFPELVVQGESPFLPMQGFGTIPPPPTLPNPPEMEITPLHTSGPSRNRVDLVFFGDGCKTTLIVLQVILLIITPQTLVRRRTNS